MKKIAIVGSGNFGANAAFYIAENNLGHVTLIDSKEGLAQGKALDMMEAAPVRGFDINVVGANDLQAIQGADVVVVAAGASRKAGASNQELLKENLETLDLILAEVKQQAPEAVVIIQREPVAALVQQAVKKHGLASGKVIGLTGLAESARFRYYTARALNVSPVDTTALVIGGAGPFAIPLVQFANVSGIPLSDLMTAGQIDQVTRQTQQGEEEILGLIKLMPPYYTPAASLGGLIAAIVRDKKRILPVTVLAQGEYGLKDVAVTLPALVGPGGVEKIVELELTEAQKSALQEAANQAAPVA